MVYNKLKKKEKHIHTVQRYSLFHHQVFQRILKAYATKLFARLPKGGMGIVAAATGMDGQIKVLTENFFSYTFMILEFFLSSSKKLICSFFLFFFKADI